MNLKIVKSSRGPVLAFEAFALALLVFISLDRAGLAPGNPCLQESDDDSDLSRLSR